MYAQCTEAHAECTRNVPRRMRNVRAMYRGACGMYAQCTEAHAECTRNVPRRMRNVRAMYRGACGMYFLILA